MNTYTIKQSSRSEMSVERSRFIAYVAPAHNINDVDKFLKFVNNDAPGARHYPYAYYIDDAQAKCSDDGEPNGTAGRPLLDLIKHHQMFHVIVVVVRYFGGIKLGAGRLLRTYVESANQLLTRVDKYQLCPSRVYRSTIKNADLQKFEYLFAQTNIEILDRAFQGEDVILTFNALETLDIASKFNLSAEEIYKSNLYRKEEQNAKSSC